MERWRLLARKLLSPRVRLSHGSGGRETRQVVEVLVRGLVPRELWSVGAGAGLDELDDAALIPVGDGFIAVTVDSYTVSPPFFPGGDIGLLAASGTINDLLMVGAEPLAALDAVVVEEGFPMEDLARILDSMASTFADNGVALIGGDFKVAPRGEVDGIIITTVGIGRAEDPIIDRPRDGDKIIVSGRIGEHGAAILSARGAFGVKLDVKSDVKPLTGLMRPLLREYRPFIHAAGDPTRGGLAMLLNEWASKTGMVIIIEEERVPVGEEVRSYSELLGIDPLALASEGVAVLAVDPERAEEIVDHARRLGYEEATIIGEVRSPKSEKHRGLVVARTRLGGFRIVEPPSGEIVPRIC